MEFTDFPVLDGLGKRSAAGEAADLLCPMSERTVGNRGVPDQVMSVAGMPLQEQLT